MKGNGIILFGDEVGLEISLKVINECGITVLALVVDPYRKSIKEWLKDKHWDFPVLFHPKKNKRDMFVKKIKSFSPVCSLVYSYSRILWKELLGLFPFGVVNMHGGKLPEYRGTNTIQWSIIQGEKETAMTLHYVDENIDNGPVIDMISVEISDEDTAFTLRNKLSQTSIELLTKWLPLITKGKVKSRPQNQGKAKVWPKRKPEDGLIDWRLSDLEIYNLIKALVSPWPGAYYYDFKGNKVIYNKKLSLTEIAKLRQKYLK